MSMFEELDSDNFTLFAAKYYRNPQCNSIEEFQQDLNIFRYVKKLTNRFLTAPEDEDFGRVFRMLMNHIITIYNVFEIEAAHRMFLYKLTEPQMTVVKPILLYLSLLEDGAMIDIPLNKKAVDLCRKS